MTRTILDNELQELDAQIVKLGQMVDDALGKSLEALETGDQAKAGMVIEADALIDSLRAAIEEHTICLLTLQQPLGWARPALPDLRFLHRRRPGAHWRWSGGDRAEYAAYGTPARLPALPGSRPRGRECACQ